MSVRQRIVTAYPGAAPVVDDLLRTARRLGVRPTWLANLIHFESQWNPQAKNPWSGASGLIQFMPATARGLGTTVEALRGMTAAQQWPYVEAYLRPFRGKLKTQHDLFMAVFYPKAIGRGPDYRFSARVAAQNPGIFTAGDYTRKALKRARLSGTPSWPGGRQGRVPKRRQSRLWSRERLQTWYAAGAAVFAVTAVVAALVARRD